QEEARAVFAEQSRRASDSGIKLEGVYLQAMAKPGLEILVSAFRDPTFGVVISCGAGGAMTEIIDDVALARAPLAKETARDLLMQLRVMRAAGGADLGPVAGFVADVSVLAAAAPWAAFTLEVNP